MVSKNQRAKGRTQQSGIIKKEAPIHVSNVMVVCPKCGEPTKTGKAVVEENGKSVKVRVCKKCGANINTVDPSK